MKGVKEVRNLSIEQTSQKLYIRHKIHDVTSEQIMLVVAQQPRPSSNLMIAIVVSGLVQQMNES